MKSLSPGVIDSPYYPKEQISLGIVIAKQRDYSYILYVLIFSFFCIANGMVVGLDYHPDAWSVECHAFLFSFISVSPSEPQKKKFTAYTIVFFLFYLTWLHLLPSYSTDPCCYELCST